MQKETFDSSNNEGEFRNVEPLVTPTGKGIAEVLRHRAERVGPYGMRDTVSFEVPKPFLRKDKLQVAGTYLYKEEQKPGEHEGYESQRQWAIRTWGPDKPNTKSLLEYLAAEETAPRTRTASLEAETLAGEHLNFTIKEGDAILSSVTIKLDDKLVKLDEVEAGEKWMLTGRTKHVSKDQKATLSYAEVEAVLTRASQLATAVEEPLDRAIY